MVHALLWLCSVGEVGEGDRGRMWMPRLVARGLLVTTQRHCQDIS